MDVEKVLAATAGYERATRTPTSADRPNRMAIVDPAHDPTSSEWPRVQFDGEPTPTRKRWPVLAGYRPRPGDRVLMVPVGLHGYVVVGSTAPPELEELVVVKENTQSVVSSTTLINDLELRAPVRARTLYRVVAVLRAIGHVDGDIKTAWAVPAGATGGRWPFGAGVSAVPTSGSATVQNSFANWSTERTFGTHATSGNSIIETGLLQTGDAGGVVQLRWAQVSAHATATQVLDFSHLVVRRLHGQE